MVRKKFNKKQANGTLTRKKPGSKPTFSERMLEKTELLSKMGATNDELALFFDVSHGTIDNWLRNYPEFKTARKRGGIEADMLVAEAMYKRARGYEYVEEEFTIRVQADGTEVKIPTRRIYKHVPSSVTAGIFWLKNRQRILWTDVNQVQHSGSIEHRHQAIQDIPVDNLSPDAQEVLFEIGTKQLTDGLNNDHKQN